MLTLTIVLPLCIVKEKRDLGGSTSADASHAFPASNHFNNLHVTWDTGHVQVTAITGYGWGSSRSRHGLMLPLRLLGALYQPLQLLLPVMRCGTWIPCGTDDEWHDWVCS